MCYQKPVEVLESLLEAGPLEPNRRGHAAMDEFDHFRTTKTTASC